MAKEVASMLAIEISILTNFVGNDLWTFNSPQTEISLPQTVRKLGYFNLISLGGAVINYAIFILLTGLQIYYLLAQLMGILIAFGWNFVINRRITWGKD